VIINQKHLIYGVDLLWVSLQKVIYKLAIAKL